MQARSRAATFLASLSDLVGAIPPEWLRSRRWFGSKSRPIQRLALADAVVIDEQPPTLLALILVRFADGGEELYQVPLLFQEVDQEAIVAASAQPILEVTTLGGRIRVYDAFEDQRFGLRLFELIRQGARLDGEWASIVAQPTALLAKEPRARQARVLGVEQSNTSVVYDDRWILKSFRRLAPGRSRDFEIARFFTLHIRFRQAPLLGGSLEYQPRQGEPTTLAVLQNFIPNQGDGWSYVLRNLEPWYRDRLDEQRSQGAAPSSSVGEGLAPSHVPETERETAPPEARSFVGATHASPASHVPSTSRVRETLGDLVESLARLGEITGMMHRALGSRPDLPDFAPEPASVADVEAWIEDARRQARGAFAALRVCGPAQARALLDREQECFRAIERLGTGVLHQGVQKIQIHGDYHLGQVLKTADGFVILDFEGEPARPLEERRAKQPAARDVAGMLRSFNYAAHAAHAALREVGAEDQLSGWAAAWEKVVGQAFLDSYGWAVAGSGLTPGSIDEAMPLIDLFSLGKAFYELRYELDNRPDWVSIPIKGIERLLDRVESRSGSGASGGERGQPMLAEQPDNATDVGENRPEAVQAVTDTTSDNMQEELGAGRDLEAVAVEAARKALQGARELGVTAEEAAAGIARGAIAAAMQVGGDVAQSAIDAGIRGALGAAKEAGENLAQVSHSAVRAGLSAGVSAGLDFVQLTESLARGVVSSAAELGGDIGAVARHAVGGAIDSAREFGRPAEDAATAAATGAVEAAGMVGHDEAQAVRQALSEPVQGVDVNLREPNFREPLPE